MSGAVKPTKQKRSKAHTLSRHRAETISADPSDNEAPVPNIPKVQPPNEPELDQPITITVRQSHFTTTRRVIMKYPESVFAAWFSGRWDGSLQYEPRFQNYDPTIFGHILEWLETGNMAVAELPPAVVEMLYDEAEYFLLEGKLSWFHYTQWNFHR